MRSRRDETRRDLRVAIECLPRHTRVAMLEGVRANPIVAGAYSHEGGICPMLAAHRNGGRTDFVSFARAWDRFALGTGRARRARRATRRELHVLITHLEASLLQDELSRGELGAAIGEHRALQAARRKRERALRPRPGDADRSRELRHRQGWSWTPAVRRLEDYERALAWVERYAAETAAPAAAGAPVQPLPQLLQVG